MVVLSVILAFLLLREPFWLVYCFISVAIATAAIYFLKTRFSFLPEADDSQESLKSRTRLRALLFFLMLLAVFLVPLVFAMFLDPYVWFILIISFTSGISLAEVFVYLQTARARG